MSNYFQEEIEKQDKVASFYENKRYNTSYSLAYHNWWARKMLSFLDIKSPVLDLGCGPGFLAQFLKGQEAVGLDISPEMIKLAQKRYAKVVQGDAQNLPFNKESFQTVISRGVLHHLPDPQKAVEEISRVLARGGQAIFAESMSNLVNSLPRKLLRGTKHFSHLHRNFQEKALREMIGSRLKIEKVYYFGCLAYLLMAFPDIIDIYKFVPFKAIFTPLLIKFDELVSKIPILNKQLCWCIMVKAYAPINYSAGL